MLYSFLCFFLKKIFNFFDFTAWNFDSSISFIGITGEEEEVCSFFLAVSSAIFVYLISIEPVKDLLLYPLEVNYTITDKLNANAIIILGGGIRSKDSLTEDTANRLLAGYKLYKKN